MAVAEKVGFDRRGNPLHVRDARGDRVVQEYEETDEIVVKNVLVERRIKRRDFIIDNDLMSLRDRTKRHDRPSVITEYHAFLERHGHELPWKKGERA